MSASLVRTNSGAQNTAAATVNPTLGGTAAAGNTLILIVAADAYIAAPDRPAGYTLSTNMGQETFLGHYLFWKVAAGGETGTSYTVGVATSSCWIMAEVSGLSSSPYDVSDGTFLQSGGASMDTPTITPSAGQRYIVASIGSSDDSNGRTITAWTNSFTEQVDINTTLGSGTRDQAAYADLAATYDGVTGVTTNGTYDNSGVQARTALIIAFKVDTGTDLNLNLAEPVVGGSLF